MVEIGKEVELSLNQLMKSYLDFLKTNSESNFKGQPLLLDEAIISVSLVGCNPETKVMFRRDNVPFIKFINPLDKEKIDVRKS